ncbi:hypothetical protein [Amphiplicatus metriothermophilus]|uniref:Uncharacterized protein n=1 Tax=Amphiplicatus metriothermophilus TaxID=1519374 RepID=A0A239PSX0_9PROT|nr:hypothetical protein [Amphiplicatus metriothermophilus]MBB5519310.1 hypothetical protein [Amphiplicatus metriothermophilus]SNT73379.1 hypothetical protein SAMN06297382_1778 [Amphiplicatus metriothermophilus]
MNNILKKLIIFASLAAAAGLARAQTANEPLAAPILNSVSASDVAAMMQEMGVASELIRIEGLEGPVLVAQTPGGGVFAFNFNGCENPAEAVGCKSVVVSTGLAAAGATYEDLNDFNGKATVTTAVGVTGRNIVVLSRNIIVAGGHSRRLFQGTVYLFLNDIVKYVSARAGVASVAFRPERAAAGAKIDSAGAAPAQPGFARDDAYAAEVSLAIRNTGAADFSLEDPFAR